MVRSGLVTDPNLLEEQLDNKMVARTNQYIDEQVLRRTGASDVVGFDADYLREHCVRQRYPTDGKTAGRGNCSPSWSSIASFATK